MYLPLSRYVFRPAGFLLTWLAIRIGLTSEAVSWLSGFVALLGCLCLLCSQQQLLPIGIGLLVLFNLLDCVDGSIARTMKTANSYGRYLDSIMAWVDMGFWALMGIMAFRHPTLLVFPVPMGYSPIFWLAVGGLACYFFNLLSYIERTFDQYIRGELESIKSNRKTGPEDTPKDGETEKYSHKREKFIFLRRIISRINHNVRVRETHYFLLILAYYCKVIDLFLIFYLFYYFLHIILLVIIYSNRGRKLRKSY